MTGNKGEWSEVYVFLKLLAEGKLNAADANLNAIPTVYYPIVKIIRQEKSINREYIINGNIKIIDSTANKEILNLPVSEFVKRSNHLFNELKKIKGSSFSFPDIEEFLHSIDIKTLKALKTDKSDIVLVVHDLNTGLKPQLGFSIKSLLGKDATLFNPGNTTNFIYEITGKGKLNINDINSITDSPFITNRIKEIKNKKFKLKFCKIQSDTLQLNLQLIDSDLPKILAELLLIKYSTIGNSSLSDALKLIKEKNPLNFDLSQGHPFYEYKLKNFLTDSALGMTPSSIWIGKYDATGGIIIVKEDGDLVCYHIYNRNEFQDYLLNNTRLEQASTSRYNFGSLYKENGKIYLKLNLQIRFN
jgi:hypothetical protein